MAAPGGLSSDEQIIVDIIINARGAIGEADDFRKAVELTKQKLRELAAQSGMTYRDLAEGMKKVAAESQEAPRAIKIINTALMELEQSAKKTETTMVSMGNAITVVFGVSLLHLVRRFVLWLKGAVEETIAFAQAIYKLEVSVRALQKRGLDVTLDGTIARIKELRKEYSFFTTREIADGIAQIQLLTRNFGFTTEQMEEMFEIASALAIVQGKDVNESARQLALFYSSGYAEALQRAGVAANKLSIEEKAHAEGIRKSFRQMTEMERAQISHLLVMEQTIDLTDEMAKFEESLYGQIIATNKAVEEQRNVIGAKFLYVIKYAGQAVLFLENALFWLMKRIADFVAFASPAFAMSLGTWITLLATIQNWEDAVKQGPMAFLNNWRRAFEEMDRQIDENVAKFKKDLDIASMLGGEDYTGPVFPGVDQEAQKLGNALVDARDEILDDFKEMMEDFLDASEDLYDDLGDIVEIGSDGLADIEEGGFERRLRLFEDFNKKYAALGVASKETIWDIEEEKIDGIGDIDEEGLRRLADIWYDYYSRIEDIQRNLNEDIEDAERDLQYDLADLAIETQRKKEDAQRKYREKEVKAERDFQERLRKLREKFLFDLEDALRERDAKQVLRLIRRFNLEMAQLEREGGQEEEERRQQFQQELEDIERQRQRKEQELRLEHQRRLVDLQLQADRERDQAERNRKRALDDLLRDLERERKERIEKYEEEIAEIAETFEKGITEIIEKHFKDFNIATNQLASEIISTLLTAFGEGGIAQGIFTSLGISIENAVNAAMENMGKLQAMEAAISGATPPTFEPIPPQGPFETQTFQGWQSGGTLYAKKPTLALFGEAGPEIVRFTPISKLNGLDMPSTPIAHGVGGALDGRMKVELWLSPGLEARIVDATLNEAGKIVTEIIKQ